MTLNNLEQGLTQIFYGNGKGKTSSAVGIAIRACGNNLSVYLIQFMKNGAKSLKQEISGEIIALKKFKNFKFKKFGTKEWVTKKPSEEQILSCKKALNFTKEILESNRFDIVIADEILYAVQLKLISEKEVIDLIDEKPKKTELILTGSHIPFENIFKKADLISEIKKIKHPFDREIRARKGIEF